MKFRGIRKAGVLMALVAALGLASCGGGDQVTPFAPNRLLAFGDENSIIDNAGRKYTINALNATSGAIDCTGNPIWIQSLATVYGLTFPECNPNAVAAPTGRILATASAKVADFKNQIDMFIAGGGVFTANDLVTVWVGMNDIFEQYTLYPATTQVALEAELTVRGAAMAAQVNRVAGLGGRVVLGKVQDLGFTPYGISEKAAHSDIDRQAVIRALTRAFNQGLLSALVNDGQHIGLFDPDEVFNAIAANPGAGNLINNTSPACISTAALPNCSSATLVPGATSLNYLWADDRHLAPAGHIQMSSYAYSRSKGNPF